MPHDPLFGRFDRVKKGGIDEWRYTCDCVKTTANVDCFSHPIMGEGVSFGG